MLKQWSNIYINSGAYKQVKTTERDYVSGVVKALPLETSDCDCKSGLETATADMLRSPIAIIALGIQSEVIQW